MSTCIYNRAIYLGFIFIERTAVMKIYTKLLCLKDIFYMESLAWQEAERNREEEAEEQNGPSLLSLHFFNIFGIKVVL